MKVLFMFGGLPHYYNKILNRLNDIENLEISVLIPLKSSVLGKGVHQTESDVKFKVIYLNEYKTYYRKVFFKDLLKVVKQNKFDAVVTIWPYILGFVFYPHILKYLKIKNIKLLYKDIPFQLPKYKDGLMLKVNEVWDESLIKIKLNIFKKISLSGLTLLRKFIYKSVVDANVDYIEDAYELLGSYGVRKNKIFITYNSPDTEALLEAKEKIENDVPLMNYNSKRIVHLGRLVKWKRVDLLIKAVSILKNKFVNIELLVIGSGPEEKELKQLAGNLNVTDKIKFIGGIYDNELLGKYMKASSIYVLAGMGGLSINEAMAFGKPVICSVCDGTEKKLVRDGFNGRYFKEGDLNDLVNKLDEVLSNENLIQTMGKNSLYIIENEVNLNTVIQGYLNAFNYTTNNSYHLTIRN